MKKSVLLLLLFAAPAILYADIPELYRKRLDLSLDYQRALLSLEQARLKQRQAESFYIPYVNIGGGINPGGGNSVTIENGLLQPLTFELQATFSNFLGADLGLSLPFTWDADTGAAVKVPTLTVSRQLFTETRVENLKARAAVLKQEQTLENLRMSLWMDLVKDICDYDYYLKVKDIQDRYANTLEKQIKAARDETAIRTLKKQWYGIRKSVMEAENALRDFSSSGQGLEAGEVPAVYLELLDYTKDSEKRLPDPAITAAPDKSILSLRLSKDAADGQAGFWFLPYLPNPVLSAGITYDLDAQAVDWNLSLGFSVSLVDRGERAVEALSRKKGGELAKLELEQAEQFRTYALARSWNQKEILKMDYEIAGITLDEKTELRDEARQLYDQGFISEEELILKQMDFQLAELGRKKSGNTYLVQLLDIMRLYGAGGEPKEE